MALNCKQCGAPVPAEKRDCQACGEDNGAPNVRLAESDAERKVLARRLKDAEISAKARNCSDVLERFGVAVLSSHAVMARSLAVVQDLIEGGRTYTSYHRQLASGARIAVDNEWDRTRTQVEAALFPNFHQDIVFASLSLKIPERLETVISDCYFKLMLQPNYREIVQQWTKNFTDKKVRRKTKRHNELVERQLMEEEADFEAPSWSAPMHENFISVGKQKRAIVKQLENGNDSRARSFTEQLIKWQLHNGGRVYAAKSLCSLAQEARRVGNTPLQLKWVKWATEIAPEDAWAHSQAGDAYFSVFQFNEADREYRAASLWGMGRRGDIGQAKVLAATGQLDEALRLSQLAITKYPLDPEAHSSYAQYSEILRKMWRLEDAFQSYEEAIEKYSDQSSLRCGRAAVLTDMSRLTEALEAYDSIINDFPAEVVAWTGRADVLKNLGELEASLDAYDEAIRRFPFEAVPVCGRADVLRSMGRLHDALAAYRDAKERFPNDPAAYSGLGEVNRELEKFDAALAVYGEAKERFPHESRIRNGYAKLLRSAGSFEEALQEYDRIVREFPYDLVTLSGRANMLKALGYYDEALEAYDVVLAQRPDYSYARHAKAAIYVIQSKFDLALELLPTRSPKTSSEWVAFHIRGMLHLRKGEYEIALDIFTKGVLESPFHQNRLYFENALAATKVCLSRYQEAINHIRQTDTVISHLLMLHSYAALGRVDEARQELAAVNDNSPPPLVELRDEIAAQFRLVDRTPKWESAWLLDRESEVLLQAA
jgi:tetratricopeptide (TPR) repeat protein